MRAYRAWPVGEQAKHRYHVLPSSRHGSLRAMTKRKLSKRQVARIQQKRRKTRESSDHNSHTPVENLLEGLVVSRYGNKADVESSDGKIVRCSFRKHIGSPVAGDKVFWHLDGGQGVIEALGPRRSELLRPDSFGNLKAVAANIDCMVITLALNPEPHSNLIDRYLVAAANLDLKVIILINKFDLINEGNQQEIEKITRCYSQLGIPIVRASVKKPHGFDELQHMLSSQTSVFVGQSGVGKSSILQKLMPSEQIKVGENSAHLSKGKHTTTNAKLYHFPLGGDCIDSPGIREFGLWHLKPEEVLKGFPDLLTYSEKCKFRNCSHKHEPGCAILQAIDNAELDRERFESYQRILLSLDEVKIKTKNLKPL